MTPRVDVCITFHDRDETWKPLCWGLVQNRRRINHIIIVRDDGRDEALELPDCLKNRAEQFSLPPGDSGEFLVSRSVNYGIEHATTPWVVHIDDDVILMPGALDKMMLYASETGLVFGGIDMIQLSRFQMSHLPRPHVHRREMHKRPTRPYHIARGACWMAPTEAFWEVGGWDEDLEGYGYQDYCFCISWMLRYGIENVRLIEPCAWSFYNSEHNKNTPSARENYTKFSHYHQTLFDKYGDPATVFIRDEAIMIRGWNGQH